MVTCQATQGGKLTEALRSSVGTTKEGKRRIFQKEGGQAVHLGLKVSDPFKVESCNYDDPRCLARPGENCGSIGAVVNVFAESNRRSRN